jgi:uncharacterized metal-binding protein
MFKSKKTAWLTIVAMLVPTTIGLFGASAAQAATATTLSTFTINGTDALTSSSVNLDVSTLNVSATGVLSTDVVAIPTESTGTSVAISGDSNLHIGANTLTATVTSTWTEEVTNPDYVAEHTIENPNYVAAHEEPNPDYNADTNSEVPQTITVPAVGEPTILVPAVGTPLITVTRNASQTYTRTLNVLNNDNTAVIIINQDELINGESTETDWGVTSVPVVVTPTDPQATVKVNGVSVALVDGKATTSVTGLTTGDNSVSVVVTAPNGEADESIFNVLVDQNTDTGATFTVDGINADDGEIVPLDYGTTDPDIEVITSDVNATFVLEGGSDLITGENPVAIYVTAEDGVTTQTYNLTLIVAANNDTAATFYVNGVATDDGSDVVLPYQTTDVAVRVELADSDAAYIVDGGSGLLQGSNDLVVTVIAADGVTTTTYAINLLVSDPDVTLKTLKLNGSTVADQGTASTTTSKNILLLQTTDSRATIAVDGGEYNASTGALVLANGRNDIAITVTGDDKSTTREYDITVNVNLDVTLKTLKFNGQTLANNSSATTWTASNSLVLEANDSRSTITVDGGTYNAAAGTITLDEGQTDVTVTVTGDDGDTTLDYVLTLGRYTLSVDWEGNDAAVSTIADGVVAVLGSVESVEVTAGAPFDNWLVEVEGDKGLDFGNNTVTVTYTSPENVEIVKTFTVFVGDADLTLSTLSVGGEDVDLTGLTGTVSLEDHPQSAAVEVETTDARATFQVSGGNNLVVGNSNRVTVVVTGADDKTATYTITVIVLPSDVTDIDALTINGDVVSPDAEITEVDAGVLDLSVDTADSNATAVVTVAPTADSFGGWATSSNGVFTGSGYLTVSVVVTAEDGTPADAVTYNLLATKDFDVTSGSNPVTDTLRVGTYAKSTPTTVASWFPTGTKLSYQWLLNGDLISSQSTSRLLLTVEHYGTDNSVRPVVSGMVAGVKKTYVGQALDVSKGIIALASIPGLNGKPQLGNTLTAVPKKWSPDVVLAYQWYVNGQAFDGATTDSFVVSEANVNAGDSVKVAVIGTLEGYEDLTKFSAPVIVTPGVLRITQKPTISVDNGYVTGSTITATEGATNYDEATVTFQWYRNGVAIAGEQGAEYTTVAADVAKKLTVVVSYAAANYSSVAITLKTPTIKVGTLDAPEVATIGLSQPGTKLIAFGGYVTTETTSSVKYIWYRNGRAVLGQNSAQYTLTSKDAGAAISVRVTAIYPGYKATVTVTTGDDNYQVD